MYNDNNGLQIFYGYSLVDITATGVVRTQDHDNIERNQQRNWETVLQCMGLRTQPHNVTLPIKTKINLDILEFGDFYTGEQTVWSWSWTVEQTGVYNLPGQPLGGLIKDFEQVPIVTGLSETARFMLPIFYPYGAIKNIYFTYPAIE
jgi:hypothetical protein